MSKNYERERIIAALDFAQEYRELGLKLVGDQPNGEGWIAAHAFNREDRNSSAAINIRTGCYKSGR